MRLPIPVLCGSHATDTTVMTTIIISRCISPFVYYHFLIPIVLYLFIPQRSQMRFFYDIMSMLQIEGFTKPGTWGSVSRSLWWTTQGYWLWVQDMGLAKITGSQSSSRHVKQQLFWCNAHWNKRVGMMLSQYCGLCYLKVSPSLTLTISFSLSYPLSISVAISLLPMFVVIIITVCLKSTVLPCSSFHSMSLF